MKKLFSSILALCSFVFLSAQVPQISLVQLATGYTKPLDVKNCGDQRLFVVEQTGYIRILYKDGTKQATPFLDIDARVHSTGDEQGLLGLAFSPNYKQDGFFYVNYINGTGNGSTRISRFSVFANDSTQADPNSEVILLTFTQPATNHNGGNMMFGPDGYLYVSQGDGGSGNDPWGTIGNGQNRDTYHGKLLRLNVTGQSTYTVPPTNPFVGIANTKPEIWAYGLRNAWRCSFDKLTGDLWIGDVGQNDWEEIDFQDVASAGGENYGWRCREGLHQCPGCGQTGCTGLGYTDPIYEVPQNAGTSCSITGGYVYRGTQYGKLFGLYLFTDYCSGNFWSIRKTGPNTFDVDTLQDFSNFQYTSFGQDNLGELYITYRGTGTGGRVYRIAETTDCKPTAFISFEDSTEGCAPVTLTALRGDTLSYQWYNTNGIIGGANSYQLATSQSGWYKVNVSKQQLGCEAMSDSVYVNVIDTTALILSNTPAVACVSSSNLNLASIVTPAGGMFSGSGVSGSSFVPASGNLGNNSVTYAYTNLSGCSSEVSFTVVLNDTSAITTNSTDTLICISEPSFIMTNYTSPVGGDFTGNGVAGTSFSPSTAGVGVSAINYTFTNIAGCESRYAFNLEVGDKTTLTKNVTDSIYCSDELPFSLVPFVSPSGGVFSGNGVAANNFDPASVTVVPASIVYDYTNSFGCVSTDSFNLQVDICGGISDVSNKISFNIFPNPSKGDFNIEVKVNSPQQADLIITDAVGKICFRKNQWLLPNKPIISLELPALAKGVYSVQLKGDSGNAVKSLVIE